MNNNHDPYTVATIVTGIPLLYLLMYLIYGEKVKQAHRERLARANRLHAQRIAAAKKRHPSSRKKPQ